MISIALIGSTGSIGRQVCNVVRRYPDRFRLSALVARRNKELFFEQISEFRPARAVLTERGVIAGMAPVPGGGFRAEGEGDA